MNPYGAFAKCYDAMMHDVDYAAWGAYLHAFLSEHGAKTVFDCACGTGRITMELGKRGYAVTGSDRSEAMLDAARQNALHAGLRTIPFVCQDLCALSVHRPMDAVVSACDGVNYLLTERELEAFFDGAFRCLKPNGLLLFDISSAYKLETVIGCTTFAETTDDYAYIWENVFDPKSRLSEMDLTIFLREGEAYRRFFERHVQRAHTEEEIRTMLMRRGFTVTGVYEAFTRKSTGPHSERIQFTAIRNEA